MTNGAATNSYTIGEDALRTLPDALSGHPTLALVDSRVWPALRGFDGLPAPKTAVLKVRGGESLKTLAGLQSVYDFMAREGLPRNGRLLGIGGGSVLDLCGFAASTWQRGIEWVAVPTTLLAAVDASIGGKTAINLGDLKNPVGTFHPPVEILMQPDRLDSLPRREWRNGMAEMIKTAVIGAPTLFRELEAAAPQLRDLLAAGRGSSPVAGIGALPWQRWITAAARVKIRIVAGDFREAGPRRALNLGHTLGHALELSQRLGHGEAVSLGTAAVCRLAAERGLCSRAAADRIIALLAACGLPTTAHVADPERIESLIGRDKKKAGSAVGWVLPLGIGRVRLDQDVEIPAAIRALRDRR